MAVGCDIADTQIGNVNESQKEDTHENDSEAMCDDDPDYVPMETDSTDDEEDTDSEDM